MDGQRYVCSEPTLIPDIRAHFSNWERYKGGTGVWPALSILIFVSRFISILVGLIIVLAYGTAHGWTGKQIFLVTLGFGLPFSVLWMLLERAVWNRDLRRIGLTRESELWGVTQFPPKDGERRERGLSWAGQRPTTNDRFAED